MLTFIVILSVVALARGSVDPGPEPPCPSDNSVKAYFESNDCAKFWQCSNGVPYLRHCARETHWSQELWTCVNIEDSECTGQGWSTTTQTSTTTTTPKPSTTASTTTTTKPTTTTSTTTTPKPTTTSATSTTTTEKPVTTPSTTEGTTSGPEAPGKCPAVDGPDSVYFPDPDCTKFWQCSNGVAYQHDCPSHLHFNSKLNVCDWPKRAGCSNATDTSTEAPTTTDDQADSSPSNDAPGKCPAVDGPDSVYFPDPDCTKFWQCSNGVAYQQDCPADLHFNPKLNVCDYPERAGCNAPGTSTEATTTTDDQGDSSPSNDAPGKCPAVDGPDSVYFPDPDCTKFWQCSNGVAYQHSCPSGLHFNPKLNVCDYPERAGCNAPGTSTEATTTTDDQGDSSPSNDAPGKCPAVDGPDSVYFPDPDCTKFWQCSNGVAYQHSCPSGLHFNPKLNVCDYPERAGCNAPGTSTEASTTTGDQGDSTPSNDDQGDSTPSNDAPGKCPAVDGPDSVYFPDPDCTKFWQCSNGVAYQHSCPSGLHFNPKLNVCDYPERAGCNAPGTSTEASTTTGDQGDSTPSNDDQGDSTPSNDAPGKCPAVDGPDSIYFPDPDCTKFWQCSNGVAYQHSCPSGLHFNPKLNVCDYPERAGCNAPGTSTEASTTTGDQGDSTPSNDDQGDSTPSNDAPGKCPAVDGPDSVYFPDPDCTKFWQCSNGVAYQHSCPSGLHFNPKLNVCDYPERAGCNAPGTSTEASTTTDDQGDSTPSNDAPGKCPAVDGPDSVYFPDPDCTKFWQCSNGVAYQHSCPSGLHFNPKLNVCDYPERAGCNAPGTSTEASTTTDDQGDSTPSNDAPGKCPAVDGPDSVYFPDPDCTKFWQCSNGVAYQHSCPSGLHFNPKLNVCDYPERAGCNAPGTSTEASTTTDDQGDSSPSNDAPGKCPAVDGPDSVYFPDPDCTKFWQCSNGVAYQHSCPSGLHFNSKLNVCDYPERAGCNAPGTSTEASTTTDDQGDSSPSNDAPGKCPAVDGPDSVYFPDPDCTKFWQCSNGVAYQHSCPSGLHFNPKLNVCDYPERAGCNAPGTSTEASTTTDDQGDSSPSNDAPGKCPAVDGPDSVYFPDPDCTKFWQCSNGVAYQHSCPSGLHFNPKLNVCDYPERAGCNAPGTSTEASTTTDDQGDSSPSNDAPGKCPAVDGPDSVYFPDPDCTKFWQCSNGVAYQHSCPSGLHFNPKLNVCDYPERAGCNAPRTSTEASTTTDDQGDSSPSNDAPGKCPAVDGPDSVYFPDPDCTKFWQCSNGVAYQHSCPSGLHFNPDLNVCDWPDRAGCSRPASTEATSTTTESEATTQEQSSTSKPTTKIPTQTTTLEPEITTASVPSTTPACKPQPTRCTCTCELVPEDEPTTTSFWTTSPSAVPNVTRSTTTEQTPEAPGKCPAVDGPDSVYFPDPDCTKFWQCSNGVAYQHSCPSGLHFNPKLNVCDWPEQAGCSGSASTEATTVSENVSTSTEGQSTTTTVDGQTSCDELSNQCPAVDGLDVVYIPLAECTGFCQCSNGQAYYHPCPDGLHFNPTLNVCDYPKRAGCTGISGTTPTAPSEKSSDADSYEGRISQFFKNLFH